MGKSRPLGRVGNERLIIDFLGRIRFGRLPFTACWLPYAACSVV